MSHYCRITVTSLLLLLSLCSCCAVIVVVCAHAAEVWFWWLCDCASAACARADTQMVVEQASMGDGDFVGHAVKLYTDLVAVFIRIAAILAKNSNRKRERN